MIHWLDWARENPGRLFRSSGEALLDWLGGTEDGKYCSELWREKHNWDDEKQCFWEHTYYRDRIVVFCDGKEQAYVHPAFAPEGSKLVFSLCDPSKMTVWAYESEHTPLCCYHVVDNVPNPDLELFPVHVLEAPPAYDFIQK